MEGIVDKDVFRRWWEYLTRSEEYLAFCLWHRERKTNPEAVVPEFILSSPGGPANHPFFYLYRIFLDIHAETYRGQAYGFEVWWGLQQDLLSRIAMSRENDGVQDVTATLMDEMDQVVEKMTRFEGRRPSFSDFKGYMNQHLKNTIPPRLLVQIDLTAEDVGPLIRGVNAMISEARQSPRTQFWQRFRDRTNWPQSRKDLALLDRYLLVYDLRRQGMKWPQIVLKVGTGKQKQNASDPNIQGLFREDEAKAKRIVQNAASGMFPGFYGKYSLG